MSETTVTPGVFGVAVGLDLSPEQFDRMIDRALDPVTPRKPIPNMPNFSAVYDSVIGVSLAVKLGASPLVCTWFEFRTLAKGKLDDFDRGLLN